MCQNLVLFDLPFCTTLSYKPSPGDVPHSLKPLVIFLGMEIKKEIPKATLVVLYTQDVLS